MTEVGEIQIPYRGHSEGKVWNGFGGQVAQSPLDTSQGAKAGAGTGLNPGFSV